MMKRKLNSLLWKINYRDISWARKIQPEDEVGVVTCVLMPPVSVLRIQCCLILN